MYFLPCLSDSSPPRSPEATEANDSPYSTSRRRVVDRGEKGRGFLSNGVKTTSLKINILKKYVSRMQQGLVL